MTDNTRMKTKKMKTVKTKKTKTKTKTYVQQKIAKRITRAD